MTDNSNGHVGPININNERKTHRISIVIARAVHKAIAHPGILCYWMTILLHTLLKVKNFFRIHKGTYVIMI